MLHILSCVDARVHAHAQAWQVRVWSHGGGQGSLGNAASILVHEPCVGAWDVVHQACPLPCALHVEWLQDHAGRALLRTSSRVQSRHVLCPPAPTLCAEATVAALGPFGRQGKVTTTAVCHGHLLGLVGDGEVEDRARASGVVVVAAGSAQGQGVEL